MQGMNCVFCVEKQSGVYHKPNAEVTSLSKYGSVHMVYLHAVFKTRCCYLDFVSENHSVVFMYYSGLRTSVYQTTSYPGSYLRSVEVRAWVRGCVSDWRILSLTTSKNQRYTSSYLIAFVSVLTYGIKPYVDKILQTSALSAQTENKRKINFTTQSAQHSA